MLSLLERRGSVTPGVVCVQWGSPRVESSMLSAEDAQCGFDLGVIEQIQRALLQGLYIPRCRPHRGLAKLQSAKVQQVEGWREEATR